MYQAQDKAGFSAYLRQFRKRNEEKGLEPSTKLLNIEVTRSDEKVSKALNIPLGSEVVKLTSLRFANDEPIVLVVTYLPHDKCKGIMDKDLEKESMYDIWKKILLQHCQSNQNP